ncbi:GNAT family N-acetyltransferase [Brumimicrobium aurantiacum]|uniref:N-acetyltransferase n=1 Tax=Brumimicrobium aurantiacum TaxID=1737063 RepID=A0A3E1F0K7_9FLAO|nr:GNAT family N-acetyltransferase [Brumimicrobium aurantiacum]RFC55346.1 N-acetyltransferase [Brumimicrobium aurantiacum]
MKTEYLFKSARLGFRNWKDEDLNAFTLLNADTEVMEHFPKSLDRQETMEFIQRLKAHYETHGYNYFAVELLENGELLGFIGLAYQNYEVDFLPAVDIGWRLKKSAWGKGYATEGALRCLDFGFNNLNLEKIISTCTLQNKKSEKVMQKIGMKKVKKFKHPKLKAFPAYENCLLYEIKKEDWNEIVT